MSKYDNTHDSVTVNDDNNVNDDKKKRYCKYVVEFFAGEQNRRRYCSGKENDCYDFTRKEFEKCLYINKN